MSSSGVNSPINSPFPEIPAEFEDPLLGETFEEVKLLAQLIMTVSISSAGAERTFSSLKRLKTRLRSTMLTDRLSKLGLLQIEARLVNTLDNNVLVDRFRDMKDRVIKLKFRE